MGKYTYKFSERSLKDLKKLPKNTAKRIVEKIDFFVKQDDPLQFANKLQNPKFGTYKFRVGSYRAIFDVDKDGNINIIFIITIKHKKEVYKNI